jgi:hypothetical protein
MIQESATAHWYPNEALGPVGRQPIQRAEPKYLLGRLPGAANDNQLVWPLIPFPEDWCGI